MTMTDRSRRWLWGLGALSLGLLSACARREYKIVPGAEPAGTCAIEGYLSGDTPPSPFPLVIVLTWDEPKSRSEGSGLFPVTATDDRFRLGGLPCPSLRNYGLSAMAVGPDGHRGGALNNPIFGRQVLLYAESGQRLTNVPLGLWRGWDFQGTVKDNSGAPMAGVVIMA